MSNKITLRTIFAKTRNLLSKKYLQDANEVITRKVIFFIKRYHLKSIGLYVSQKNEIDTNAIIAYCLANDINLYIPNCEEQTNQMTFKKITDANNDFEYNEKLKIIQAKNTCPDLIDPNLLDAIFLPLIVFDRNLTRIGFGKGYYDRWFNENHYSGYKIGLAPYTQLTNKLIEAEPTDVQMNFCITEKEIFVPIIDEDEETTHDFDITYWRLNDPDFD